MSFLSLLLFSGTLHSNGYIFPFLLCLSLLFFSQLFVKPSQTAIFPSCISFSLGWFWSLPPVQCHEPPSIVLQALCQPDLTPWIYLSFPLYNQRIWFRSYLNGLVVFPTFFNLSLNFSVRSSLSGPQSAPGLVFADCIFGFSIFGWKSIISIEIVIGHLVMSMCTAMSCVVGRRCLLWLVCSLGKTVSLGLASFCIAKQNLSVTPGISWLPTFAFQYPMVKRTSFGY